MQAKLVSIKDGTKLPQAKYLMVVLDDNQVDSHDGIVSKVVIGLFDGSNVMSSDPTHWGNESIEYAHNYLIDNFASVNDGDVIDVAALAGG